MIKIVPISILEATESHICHQCNSVTNHAAGLAKAIFDKFPYADIYSSRSKPYFPPESELPGNIVVCGNGIDCRCVINMIAQYYPGKSKYPDGKLDGIKAREEAFNKCLQKIKLLTDLESIAFPINIGCTLAGGNWENYLKMIEEFAEQINVPVSIYNYQFG